jgi:hypothetical protein
MSDFESYWVEWNKMFTETNSSRLNLKEIIQKVLDNKMLLEQKREGWLKELPPAERRFMLNKAVRGFMNEQCKD